MENDLDRASLVTPLGDGAWSAQFPDGWQQGPGAYGGLVVATLLRAVEAAEPERERTLRSISAEICAPVRVGAATIRVEALRRGAAVGYYDARLVQGGEVQARASVVLGAARALAAAVPEPVPPALPAWESLPVIAIGPPIGPRFAAHFEYRPTGLLPFSGGREATASGFLRERSPRARFDAPAVLAYLDAWWPALFAVEPAPRPCATVSFIAQLLVDPAAIPTDAPLFHRARVEALRDGYFVEVRELWSGSTLVALNQQTFAVLR
jgi:hypothetical protein